MECISWNVNTVNFALIKPVGSEAPVAATYTVGQAVWPWAGAAEWKQYWPKSVVNIFAANQSISDRFWSCIDLIIVLYLFLHIFEVFCKLFFMDIFLKTKIYSGPNKAK